MQTEPRKLVTWSRKGGYECFTRGDKRFSALCAAMPVGRTIEQHYQCEVKGYRPGGTTWRRGKGKPPLDPSEDQWVEYLRLWQQWARLNPSMLAQLAAKAAAFDNGLSHMFATTPVNQARALAEIPNALPRE